MKCPLCWTHFKARSGFTADSTKDDWLQMLYDNNFEGPDWPRTFASRRDCPECILPEDAGQGTLQLEARA